jgi:predicted outer membrane protein
MNTFSTGAKPTALRLAIVMTGVIGMVATSTLAHGQVVVEAGALARQQSKPKQVRSNR